MNSEYDCSILLCFEISVHDTSCLEEYLLVVLNPNDKIRRRSLQCIKNHIFLWSFVMFLFYNLVISVICFPSEQGTSIGR